MDQLNEIRRKVDEMSGADLAEMQKLIDQRIAERKESAKKELLAAFIEQCQQENIAFDEVVAIYSGAARKGGRRRTTLSAQYHHPNDPTLVWTGHGRKPRWLEQWLEEGNTIDALKKL